MAPKGWTTDALSAFLHQYLPLYDKHAFTKRYQPFWDTINAKYLQEFPILPEGVSPDSLNDEERQAYSETLNKLYSRIKDWYRWRRNGRSRNTTHTVTSKQMREIYAGGTRTGKEYEVYVKMYPGAFQPAYDAECSRICATGRAKLAVWHKIAKEVWENASDEEKSAVQAQLILDKEAVASEEQDPSSPDDYQRLWDRLPAILSKAITPAVQKAGVLAFVTIVGPVPNAGGQILATMLQFGDKSETPLFSNVWKDHDRVLVDKLAAFAARHEFPPDICAKRSLGKSAEDDLGQRVADAPPPVKESGSVSSTVDLPSETLPSVNGPALTKAAFAESSMPNDNETTRANSRNWWQNWADPDVLETIALQNASDAPPAPSDNSHHSGLNVVPEHSNTGTFTPPVLHQSASNPVSTESNNVPLPVFNTATVPFAPHAPSSIPASVSTSVQRPALNTSSAICAPLDGQGLNNSVSNPMAASRLGAPPQTLSLFSTPVTLEITSTNPQLPGPQEQLAKENVDPSPNNNSVAGLTGARPTGGPLRDLSGNGAQTAGPFGARPTGVLLQDLSGNGAQTAGPNEVRPAPPQDVPTNDAPAQGPNKGRPILLLPVPTPSQDDRVRRSNRAPIPTTRLDRQNEIGTNIVPPKPLVDATAVIEEPLWFAPAYDYLKNNTLGTMWVDLVEKWAEYERAKAWKTGKGLPAQGQPEEWQQWTSKARWGVRDYSRVPDVRDAADLGIAVTKWASSFSSADFGKTGLHGMVALLTLMVWWGTAALTPLSWNSDSRPQWQELVLGLSSRYTILLGEFSDHKRSRDDDGSGGVSENKRP
ncbi:hypothetical protein EST38_g10204 [Candolleomyces aberdarensis]|uniref:Uncharacterized protein n=1 Tax=Candolleomyces aberdarensis TaxID=2316362 RepID=A0A4Q2DAF2_9AGAR|nr:hypothetical protein EST38_g10204 [Candolleomyces aberdarensis]